MRSENHRTSRFRLLGRLLTVTTKPPFEAIVSEHGRTVLRVCRAVVGMVDADDAWSDTFLSALEAYPRLPANANIEAWLVTIAHRKAIDVTRKAARRAVPVEALPSGTAANGEARDLDLVRSLAALPKRQRYAVVYHYIAGLPYRDIAAIVGGTADAARRAAADGIARLRNTQAAQDTDRVNSRSLNKDSE